MIGRVLPKGQKAGGLLGYLYGPGRHHEHSHPHIVASWTGETLTLEPVVTATGRRDFRQLVGLLQAPINAMPSLSRPADPIYHVAVRNHADDRILSDAEWQDVAEQIMHDTGLAPRDDPNGVRWIAVRHADDHIHIVATLARQDNRVARHDNDFLRLRNTCRIFERRYGLVTTAPADQTAARRPTRGEQEKARRAGWHQSAREKLRREVRVALSGASTEEEFFARLRGAGVIVRLRHSTTNPLDVTGYSVGLPDAKTAAGTTVWYSGGKLAKDLTLPKIRTRWAPTPVRVAPRPPVSAPAPKPTPTAAAPAPEQTVRPIREPAANTRPRISTEQRRAIFAQAIGTARAAAATLRRLLLADPAAASAVAYAASEALTIAARITEGPRGRGPLTQAAEAFDHAARHPYGRPERPSSRPVPRAEGLRSSTRLLAAVRRIRPDDEALRVAELVLTLASLADTVAVLRDSQHRLAQARAARQAAGLLRAYTATHPPVTIAPSSPTPRRRPTPQRPAPRPPGPAPRI